MLLKASSPVSCNISATLQLLLRSAQSMGKVSGEGRQCNTGLLSGMRIGGWGSHDKDITAEHAIAFPYGISCNL